MSPILVTLTSLSDSDFESSNVSLKENKPDVVNPNSNDINYYVRRNEGKISLVFGRLRNRTSKNSVGRILLSESSLWKLFLSDA